MRFDKSKPIGFEKDLVKVAISLGIENWHGFSEELMWAKPMDDGRYELQNTPFFAKGFAFLDSVLAQEEGNRLLVVGTSAPSRHSTYRAVIQSSIPRSSVEAALNEMASLGTTFESYEDPKWTLYAFDVPPSVVDSAYKTLDKFERQGLWDFEEGHFGGRDQ
jgi:Domain of unknown function (DUF4265)